MTGTKFERKRLYINSRIQGQILLRIGAYWVIYHLVMWHTLFMFHYFSYRVEVLNGSPALPFAELYSTFCLKYYPIALSALACTPLLMGDVLKMTHRIAGPLFRIEKAMQAILGGERVEKVTLRDHDLLTDFRDKFNIFLEDYNAQRDRAQAAEARLAALETPASSASCLTEEQLLNQVEELRATASTDPSPAR